MIILPQPINLEKSIEIASLYFDASCRDDGALGGFVLEQSLRVSATGVYRFGNLTINDAELMAALSGLQCALQHHCKHVQVFGDNITAVNVINEIRRHRGARYLNTKRETAGWNSKSICRLILAFDYVEAYYIGRDANWSAHTLVDNTYAKEGASTDGIPYWSIDS